MPGAREQGQTMAAPLMREGGGEAASSGRAGADGPRQADKSSWSRSRCHLQDWN